MEYKARFALGRYDALPEAAVDFETGPIPPSPWLQIVQELSRVVARERTPLKQVFWDEVLNRFEPTDHAGFLLDLPELDADDCRKLLDAIAPTHGLTLAN